MKRLVAQLPQMAARCRRGTIFVLTMWIVLVLAGVVIVLAQSMRTEAIASANQLAAVQASAVERGAEQYVLSLIDQEADGVLDLTEEQFKAYELRDGYFWIVKTNFEVPQTPAYGIVDEASKVNLNTASNDMLLALPGMTEELAGAIIDWRDQDGNITANGAENEYYTQLPHPYLCKNAPLETVEELLLVSGATAELLYGENAVGVSNPTLLGGNRIFSTGDPLSYRGIYDYLTVYSAEPAAGGAGGGGGGAGGGRSQSVNVGDRRALTTFLQSSLGAARANQVMATAGIAAFRNSMDLYVRGRMKAEEFDPIAARLTSGTGNANAAKRGLINITTAPHDVLMCLPGLSDDDVTAIINQRDSITITPGSIAWVGDLLQQKAVPIANSITVHAYQFSAEIVAASRNGRAFKRCRIVVNAQSSPAKIVYRRDLTEQGWPLTQDVLLQLRQGAGMNSNAQVTLGDMP